MDDNEGERQKGSTAAPTRHPLRWQEQEFYDESALFEEMERVFDICHSCRRCFSLCHAFPTLFDLVDESETGELDSVGHEAYWDVVDNCYLCDMCFMTKCPYVPPHPWNVDFPHLMLRAKAVKYQRGDVKLRDRVLTSTDRVGTLAGIPVVARTVNRVNRIPAARKALEKTFGVHHQAPVPEYHSDTLRRRMKNRAAPELRAEPTDDTTGRVALFATCYCNYNRPDMGEDLVAVFEHNGIPVRLAEKERCCGMPKLEAGDLESVNRARQANIPVLARLVDEGWDIVAPVPSCVLMFKQELPLMFPDDPEVQKVRQRFFDPFEYLERRHKAGKLRTDFEQSLGRVSYHVPCHLRVQNIGLKTRDVLKLVPDTKISPIARCSGHDGTYAVKAEFYETAQKIARPVVNKVRQAGPDHYTSDCPMAGDQIGHGVGQGAAEHPLRLLRTAYGI
ncbi:MAG TPA: heterodisulfide reductase-related iron-sulfur binding cluster [Gammaproteobacteria bacterium]|nr:heterodisulfide reductase-related iron-sulfur binding cluster [Gammaproteobacteria bacterium]